MTDFVVLGGYPLQVKSETASQLTTNKGDVGVSHTGVIQDARRDDAFEATYLTPCTSHAEAWAIRNLIDGSAHRVDFAEGLEASSGLEPLPDDYDLTLDFTGGRWATAALLASGSTLTYPAQLAADWSLCITLRDSTDPADVFDTFVVRSDGQEWKNGTAGTHNTANFVSVDSQGNCVVTSNDKTGTAAAMLVDEIGLFAFLLSDEQAATFSRGVEPLSPFPRLELHGDQIPGFAGLVVVGELEADAYLQGAPAGAWENDLAEIGFTVREWAEVLLERTPLPVSLYTFDDVNTVGTVIEDVAGVQNASLAAPATSGDDIGREGHGEALNTAAGGRAFCVDVTAHDITGDLTVCGWLRLDSLPLSNATIAAKLGLFVGTSFPFHLYVTPAGLLGFQHASGATVDTFGSTEAVSVGEWVFVSATRNAGDVELRVNCRRDPAGATAATVVPGASNVGLSMGDSLPGLLDEVAVFNSALSDAELFALYLGSRRGERYEIRG